MKRLFLIICFLLISVLNFEGVVSAAFDDISSSHTNYAAVQALTEAGVVFGYPDNTFRPENLINRAEVSAIIVRALHADPDIMLYKNCFSDVHEQWFAKHVCFGLGQLWLSGYPGTGLFKPESSVLATETLRMAFDGLGVARLAATDRLKRQWDVPKGYVNATKQYASKEWYEDYLVTSREFGYLDTTPVATKLMTRAEVAEVIYRIMLSTDRIQPFSGVAVATPVPPTPPVSTPIPAPATTTNVCAEVYEWSTSKVYTEGDQASYQGTVYEAKWWTQGANPSQSGQWDVWKVAEGCGSSGGSGTSTTTPTPALVGPVAPPGEIGDRLYAPYADMGLWPTFNLTQTAKDTGIKFYTLAFINSRGCDATWFGIANLSHDVAKQIGNDLNSLRALGGDAIVSFGGATGIELAEACSTVEATQAQYQRVIDQYGFVRLDFDIEGAAITKIATNTRRAKAIAALQAANPGLDVSFTLPVLPTGLTQDGVNFLLNAARNGVQFSTVNLMTFDYGSSFQGDMGDLAIQSAHSVADQLVQVYPELSQAQRREMIGVTPMFGKDDQQRIFDQADAREVLNTAKAENWARLSGWGIHRDHACGSGVHVLKCSGIQQQEYEFSGVFKSFP